MQDGGSTASGRDGALAGKRALVAGGGGGLGRAMAAALHREGAHVAILGRSASADEAAAALATPERPAFAVRADLTDRAALREAFLAARDRLGGVDVLIAAQGHTAPGPALEQDLRTWDETLETNLTSTFELAQLSAREMATTGGGKIVFVASMLSFFGGLNAAAYAAAKGGVAQLTKALANEWAPLGINVNAIAPGYIKTNLNRHIWHDDPKRTAEILARLPAGRWGEPDDMAGPVVFLCSPASDYLQGVVMPVDGGYLSR